MVDDGGEERCDSCCCLFDSMGVVIGFTTSASSLSRKRFFPTTAGASIKESGEGGAAVVSVAVVVVVAVALFEFVVRVSAPKPKVRIDVADSIMSSI